MRGSGTNWPADVAPDATNRTGGSRLLLDELLAERERAQAPTQSSPPPVLTVDPVAVPPSLDNSRKASRQRLVELENAAMRNYHSAEEARRALGEEHMRLEQELAARAHAEREAGILRRELERISNDEARRAELEKNRAKDEARAAMADEVKRYQDEHQRVLEEMSLLRSSMTEHDGLLDEYVTRLREEQEARASMRAEIERAEAARSLAERSLQRATDKARQGAEDQMGLVAALEQELADVQSDRDRLASKLADLTAGNQLEKLTAETEEKSAEIAKLGARIADLGAAVEAAEAAAGDAATERDAAVEARNAAEAMLAEAERARDEADRAADAAAARIDELEGELSERGVTDDERSREIDQILGKLRREAQEASNARHEADEALATAEAERDELRARVADLDAEVVRARAEGDRLRALAAASGDGSAAARATETELQAAAPAHLSDETPGEARASRTEPVSEIRREDSSEESSQRGRAAAPEAEPAAPLVKPPLPSRRAGRRAPMTEPVRTRPKRDPALADAPVTPSSGSEQPMAPAWAAAIQVEPRDRPAAAAAPPAPAAPPPAAAETEAAAAVAEADPAPAAAADGPPVRPALPEESIRRTAFAEFGALASTNDARPARSR